MEEEGRRRRGTCKMRTILPVLITFFLFTLTFCTNSHANDELSALLSIKSGLADPTDALHDWRTPATTATGSSSYCNWTGVGCDASGSVMNLDLQLMNLSGLLAADGFGGLPAMERLNICCNAFSSPLPSNLFSNLTMLKVFDISDNNFVGGFPSGLGTSPRLAVLNASGNNFVGVLPEDVGNATSLKSLDLRGCYFTGSIPPSYANLQKLEFLGLSGNNLSGQLPAALGRLSSLEELIIGYNDFEGSIPAEFGNLSKLQYLDLVVGNLTGSIPPELGKLKLLTTVFIFNNNLGGDIPAELGNLTSLELLDLSDNQITGEIPAELGRLSNLQLLNLMCNQLQGWVPAGIGDLTNLQVLELWNNSLSGELPRNLGRSSPLQWLDVSSNNLSGKIPDGLCDRGKLTKLILFNNAFSGNIPNTLTACSSLVRVRVQNNRLNGTIPLGFGNLMKIQRLELASNVLSGEIPDDISSSTSLAFIDLSHNRLQLSLPSNILSVPTLQSFLAARNELTGGIPDEFQDCASLAALDLSDNRFTGGIPASLASCERLVSLDLRGNSFNGEIPPAIATMPSLAILDLSDNLLTGEIPGILGNSPALETLNLSYNNLSGPVPETGMLRTINPDDLAGNAGLCGGVLPPCDGETSMAAGAGRKASRIKHLMSGWTIGVALVLAMMVAAVGGRRIYKYWREGGGCCEGCFGEENGGGAWPWRMTAFQRLSFTSGEVLACIKESNVIGMGAAGVVYKADLQHRHAVVAVKKIWRRGSSDGEAGEIVGEVSVLGRLRHRNIVRLLGYLHNDTETMILYEFMPHGNLWEALHGKAAGKVLVDWASRYNVAAGVAQGLAYLHHDCHPPIIHRDVKSNNILLDTNFEARIADFGLARMMDRKNETVSEVAGSHGYIAPEYGYTLKVDHKIDIYSFGVVLMELVTGRTPIEAEFGESQDIVGWVRERLNGKEVSQVLDQSIAGQCGHVQEEMMLALRIAVLCTARKPKDRPSMRDVLTMLAEAKPRRKSSSAAVASGVLGKDIKLVFSTSPDLDYD